MSVLDPVPRAWHPVQSQRVPFGARMKESRSRRLRCGGHGRHGQPRRHRPVTITKPFPQLPRAWQQPQMWQLLISISAAPVPSLDSAFVCQSPCTPAMMPAPQVFRVWESNGREQHNFLSIKGPPRNCRNCSRWICGDYVILRTASLTA